MRYIVDIEGSTFNECFKEMSIERFIVPLPTINITKIISGSSIEKERIADAERWAKNYPRLKDGEYTNEDITAMLVNTYLQALTSSSTNALNNNHE